MSPFRGLFAWLPRSRTVLKWQTISTGFLLRTTAPCVSQIVLKFGLRCSTYDGAFSPNFAPNWPTLYWFERRRHSTVNFGRTVRNSAMVTMNSLYETTIALSNGIIADPLRPPLPPKWGFLCIRAISPFAKLLWPLLLYRILHHNHCHNTSHLIAFSKGTTHLLHIHKWQVHNILTPNKTEQNSY